MAVKNKETNPKKIWVSKKYEINHSKYSYIGSPPWWYFIGRHKAGIPASTDGCWNPIIQNELLTFGMRRFVNGMCLISYGAFLKSNTFGGVKNLRGEWICSHTDGSSGGGHGQNNKLV